MSNQPKSFFVSKEYYFSYEVRMLQLVFEE